MMTHEQNGQVSAAGGGYGPPGGAPPPGGYGGPPQGGAPPGGFGGPPPGGAPPGGFGGPPPGGAPPGGFGGPPPGGPPPGGAPPGGAPPGGFGGPPAGGAPPGGGFGTPPPGGAPAGGAGGQAKNSTLAVVSLVTGILALIPCCNLYIMWLIAIITGVLAKKEIKEKPGLKGDNLALAGIIMGALGFLIIIIVTIINIASGAFEQMF